MKLFVQNKKGSLSLSMEAIVILILAVVMLGLGLTFVRTMFSNITDKAGNALDVADLTAKPSEGDEVVFSPASPEIKEGKTENVQVGFYNPSTTNEQWVLKILDDDPDMTDSSDPFGNPCGGLNTSGADELCYDSIATIYKSSEFKLEKDKAIGWNVILKPLDGAVPDGEASKPFLLTVLFCSVPDGEEDCDETSEMFQKEIFLTVRK